MHFILNGGAYVNGIVAACDHQSSLYASCIGESIQHIKKLSNREKKNTQLFRTPVAACIRHKHDPAKWHDVLDTFVLGVSFAAGLDS